MRFFRSLALLLLILALTACTPPPSTAPTEPPPSPAPSASPTIEQGPRVSCLSFGGYGISTVCASTTPCGLALAPG